MDLADFMKNLIFFPGFATAPPPSHTYLTQILLGEEGGWERVNFP